jgi:hypothetical protein
VGTTRVWLLGLLRPFAGRSNVRTIAFLLFAFGLRSRAVTAQNPSESSGQAPDPRPEYQLLRDEEDWSFLRNTERKTDVFDPVKFVPFAWPRRSFLSLGGEWRHQYERFTNEEWGAEPMDRSGYLLQRYMLHADVHLGQRVRFFTQVKSGIETGRRGGPRPPDEDRLDLHQAFAEVGMPSGSSPNITLRAGRQELNFGSGRLVSVREGPTVRQSFDAIKVAVARARWRADAFVSRPVMTTPPVFDDPRDRGRALWGIYATRNPQPGPGVDLYYLGYTRRDARFDQGIADERRHSVGARVWQSGTDIDTNTEAVVQWGTFGHSEIRAWTVASDIGYRILRRGGTRVGVRADITSGDRDRTDHILGTFNPLFPKGGYFGLIAPTGPLNHVDVHPSIRFSPAARWSLSGSWLFFWRAERDDGLYGVPGNLLRSGEHTRTRFVGHSPGIEVEWQVSRHLSVTGDVALFTAGSFLNESSPSRTITYVAVWTTYKF